MTSRSAIGIAAGLFVALGLLTEAAAQSPAAKGDLWETTSQPSMTMGGTAMPMPPQTQRNCAAKTWTKPPAAESRREMTCTTSDFAIAGPKITWTSVCAGQMKMTGKGEIIRQSPDTYTGTVKYVFAEGALTVALTGKRVGECDNPQ